MCAGQPDDIAIPKRALLGCSGKSAIKGNIMDQLWCGKESRNNLAALMGCQIGTISIPNPLLGKFHVEELKRASMLLFTSHIKQMPGRLEMMNHPILTLNF
jgi:hypothetical protein